jgi:hypothetical protein
MNFLCSLLTPVIWSNIVSIMRAFFIILRKLIFPVVLSFFQALFFERLYYETT